MFITKIAINIQRSFYDYDYDEDYDEDYDYEYKTEDIFKRRRKSKAPQDYDYDYDYEYDYDYAFEDDSCFNCAADVNIFVMDSLQNKSETSLTFPFVKQWNSLSLSYLTRLTPIIDPKKTICKYILMH